MRKSRTWVALLSIVILIFSIYFYLGSSLAINNFIFDATIPMEINDINELSKIAIDSLKVILYVLIITIIGINIYIFTSSKKND